MSLAAIDQGTTSTRLLLIGDTNNKQSQASGDPQLKHALPHQQTYPRSGWVEQCPHELLNNIHACLGSLNNCELPAAIGLANQGESCLAWDSKTGEPITPVISWQDSRTQASIKQLQDDGAQELTLARAGLPLETYFSASTLGWIMEQVPEAKSLLRNNRLCLGTTDAFFLQQLTGHFATDISTASRTSLMNLQTGQWDPDLCDLFKVPIEALPEIRSTTGDFGEVQINQRSVPVTASVVDQQASLYGHGCRQPGDLKITFGTGAFALSVTEGNPLTDNTPGLSARDLIPTVAWQLQGQEPVYAFDGGVFSAGSAIDWARKLGLFQHLDQLTNFNPTSAIDRGLVFVPALTGLGAPHWDHSAAGLWIGLSLEHSAMDLLQAILEGIALRTAEVVEAHDQLIPIKRFSIDGGLINNAYFTQYLVNILGRPIEMPQQTELTAYGCALLAGDSLGNKQFVSTSKAKQAVLPNSDSESAARYRFAEAVGRSKHWRSV